jgi:hypothetical protein
MIESQSRRPRRIGVRPAALGLPCLLAILLASCADPAQGGTPTPLAGREHENHETLPPGATPLPDQHTDTIDLAATLPKDDHSSDFYNSDLAFWGDMAVQGSYDGFRLIDISQPTTPRLIADVECRGPQGDVAIWETLIFVSVDRPQTTDDCDSQDAQDADPLLVPEEGGWEGVRIFDVSVPAQPRLVASVQTDCGSHTHSLVPDSEHGRLFIYVSSSALRVEPNFAPTCTNPHGHISVIEVPLDDPAAATVVSQPRLLGTPAWELWPGAPEELEESAGCHDITVYQRLQLAAAACMSDGQIWDISDASHPAVLAHVDLPEVSFWHSAAWSNDGSVVAFGDENLAEAGCTDTPHGSIWFYRVDDPAAPQLAGRFSLDRYQGNEICSSHMFNVIPGIDRDLLVAAFYSGGTAVIDFTDPTAPVEVAYFDVAGWVPGDQWAAYWYRGFVYASDHLRGLDVFRLSLPEVVGAQELPHLNPQLQE